MVFNYSVAEACKDYERFSGISYDCSRFVGYLLCIRGFSWMFVVRNGVFVALVNAFVDVCGHLYPTILRPCACCDRSKPRRTYDVPLHVPR